MNLIELKDILPIKEIEEPLKSYQEELFPFFIDYPPEVLTKQYNKEFYKKVYREITKLINTGDKFPHKMKLETRKQKLINDIYRSNSDYERI